MAYKTPALLISRNRILRNYRELHSAFPDFEIAYAIKSNSFPGIIETLRDEGSSFETASWAEISFLLGLGIPPEKIVFSNPMKPSYAIEKALDAGVYVMSFDSLDEVDKLAVFRDRVKAVLRIQVPNEGSMWPLTGKFGVASNRWPAILERMQKRGLPLAGITYHPGSQCETILGWEAAMKHAYDIFSLARSMGFQPEILNIGGGFPTDLGRPIPSVASIAKVVYKHLNQWDAEGLKPKRLLMEPGRGISGSAGILVTRVIGTASRDKDWAFLDVGVFTGMMETIDGITYPLESSAPGEWESSYILCGPSCDSVDKMFTAYLPKLREGDLVAFRGAGAYTTVYGSNFNGFDPPTPYYMDELPEGDAIFAIFNEEYLVQ